MGKDGEKRNSNVGLERRMEAEICNSELINRGVMILC
jgi:hypothetical protein